MGAEFRALRDVAANAQMRRLHLAWLATSLGVWGGALALGIYAYGRGGPAAVGVMALLRALPGAPVAPFLAVVVDRVSRRRVMLVSSVARAAIMLAIAAAAATDASLGVIYALVVVLAVVSPAYRPAFMTLLPRVAKTPGELASANVASSLVLNAGFLIGALLTGLLLGVASAEVVFAGLGAAFAAAVLPLLRVEPDPPPEPDPDARPVTEMLAGFRTVAGDPGLRELVLIGSALTFVDGAIDVLVVVAAFSFLDVGEAGAGYLSAVWGLGCVAGGAVVLALLGRGRLVDGITAGALVLGAGAALTGAVPAVVAAIVGLLVFGVGYTLVEVAVPTLQQRLAADHVLGRVSGVTEATTVTATALGALAAGLLADAIGARGALIATGALLPALVLLRRARLARLEAGAPVAEREYGLLRSHPIFAPLPIAETERLALALEELHPVAGQQIIVQGDPGDRFYLIVEGRLDIHRDGVYRRTRGPGEGVGETALVRDVPRTATVTAHMNTVLLALDRDSFLAAVTSQPPARRATERIAAERMGPVTPDPSG